MGLAPTRQRVRSGALRLGHCPRSGIHLNPVHPLYRHTKIPPCTVITVSDIELRAGSRLLLEHASFRIAPGDRVGLVGRNGAGKTTLTKVLAGVGQPAGGTVSRSGTVGYLPQDPRTGDLDVLARNRILGARGLDRIVAERAKAEQRMASADPETMEKAMRRY